jgi:hypothetical protein
MPLAGARIDVATREEHGDVATAVSFVRRHEADGAVAMLAVVPADKALDPRPRSVERFEGLAWV